MKLSKILNSLENSWRWKYILLKIKNCSDIENIIKKFLINNEAKVKQLNSLLKPEHLILLNQIENYELA